MSLLKKYYAGGTLPTVKYIDLSEFSSLSLEGKTVVVGGITYTLSTTGETTNSIISKGESNASNYAHSLEHGVNADHNYYGVRHNVITPNLTCYAESYGTRVYFATRLAGATLTITGSFTVYTLS